MSPAERKNACISVEFESPGIEDVALGHSIEQLWSGGQCDEALAKLGDLETRVGHVAIGNSWRKPVSTIGTGLWGGDVRIDDRDMIRDVASVIDDSSGNICVALRREVPPHWLLCVSADKGATWQETFTWIGSPPTSIDVAAISDHFYVVYNSPGENAHQARLRRFWCSDGQPDTFRAGKAWVAACNFGADDTVMEAALAADHSNSILYGVCLGSDQTVRISGDLTASCSQWTAIASGAGHGLAATDDSASPSRYSFFSYYDTAETLRVYCFTYWGRRSELWGLGLRFSQYAGSGTMTSLSAFGDTVICAFEDAASSVPLVRYAVGHAEHGTWTTGTLSSADTAAAFPAVAASAGGFAAVYYQSAPIPQLRLRWRASGNTWSDPVPITDNEPFPSRSAIEYLGDSVYAAAYLSSTGPVVRGAYFGRSDWPYGLAGQRQPQTSSCELQATVLRGVLNLQSAARNLHTAIILLDASGRKVLDLKPGPNDVSPLVPGVYFVKDEEQSTRVGGRTGKVVVTR
jgi:hypothetical protein